MGRPEPALALSAVRLHVLGGSGKTRNLRLVATGRPQQRKKLPLVGLPKITETNYVCLMRKGSSSSSQLPAWGGETDMQMHHASHSAVAKYVPA